MQLPNLLIVISGARTGSTYLLERLQSQEKILGGFEIFKPVANKRHPAAAHIDEVFTGSDPIAFIEKILARVKDECHCYCFKLFYSHMDFWEGGVLWEYLGARANTTLVHSLRRDRLAQFLSLRKAEMTDQWQLRTGGVAKDCPPFRVDPERLQNFLNYQEKQVERTRSLYKNNSNYHELYYEDLIENEQRELQAICNRPGLKYRHKEIGLCRQRTGSPQQLITNYAELSEYFSETGHARHFADKC